MGCENNGQNSCVETTTTCVEAKTCCPEAPKLSCEERECMVMDHMKTSHMTMVVFDVLMLVGLVTLIILVCRLPVHRR